MRRKVLLGLLLVCLLLEMPLSYAIPDPSAEYCQGLGYDILVEETEEGQVGICKFPDGSSCPTWDFLRGKCGEDWSYCKQRGYEMKTIFTDEWSSNAVCVLPDGGEAEVLDLMRCEMAGGKWEDGECKCPDDCTYLWDSCWIKTPIEACSELGGEYSQSFMVGPVGCNFLCLRDGEDITDLAREKAELLVTTPTPLEVSFEDIYPTCISFDGSTYLSIKVTFNDKPVEGAHINLRSDWTGKWDFASCSGDTTSKYGFFVAKWSPSNIPRESENVRVKITAEASKTGYENGSTTAIVIVNPKEEPYITKTSATKFFYKQGETLTLKVTVKKGGEPAIGLPARVFIVLEGRSTISSSFGEDNDFKEIREGEYELVINEHNSREWPLDKGTHRLHVEIGDVSLSDIEGKALISIEAAPPKLPGSKGPLKVHIDCPSRVDPNSEFEITAKIENPSKTCIGYYAIFQESDLANCQILVDDGIDITSIEVCPNYVLKETFQNALKGVGIPFIVVDAAKFGIKIGVEAAGFVLTGKALYGIINVPTTPIPIVAMASDWVKNQFIAESNNNFVLHTCKAKYDIKKGVPIPPCTSLLIEMDAKAPSTNGEYELGISIPYSYVDSDNPYNKDWHRKSLSSGRAVGSGMVNVHGFWPWD